MNPNQKFTTIIFSFIGFLFGIFVMYVGYIKNNIIISEENYKCVSAEPLNKDPSIVACTIFLRTTSESYKQYLEMNQIDSL